MALQAPTASPPRLARVEIAAPPLIVRLVGRPLLPEAGASHARLCRYAVAKVLQKGSLDLADFRVLRWPIPRRTRWRGA